MSKRSSARAQSIHKTLRKYALIKKILSISLSLFLLLTFANLIACLGVGGVLNDLDSVLEEIEYLEKNNLLDSPPDTIDPYVKLEIELCHDSAGLKKYISETEKSADYLATDLYIFVGLSLLSLILRIYFGRKYQHLLKVSKSSSQIT